MDSNHPPQASIEFARGFSERVARFAFVQAAARRTPREDFASSASRSGHGAGEFAGRRRYRPGDDLRAFDWEALARGAGALIRLRSRESSERWNVLLDTSASMAVGNPPKVQLAGELALAICAVGLQWKNEVRLATQRGFCVLRAKADLARAFAELDGQACAGPSGFANWFGHPALSGAQRWIAIGDLFDLDPAIVARFAAQRRRLDAIAVLAPVELSPQLVAQWESVEWRDPENGAKLALKLDPETLAGYAAGLSEHLGHWRASLARARGELVIARAADPFEPHARHWIAGRTP